MSNLPLDGRRKARSPYKRHNKTPFKYSPLFYQWLAAAKSGDVSLADELGRRHTRAFGGRP